MTLERWEIESGHSVIRFSVRHMVVAKVLGQFTRWGATFRAEDGDLGRASLEAVIDASSIQTGIADRDAHLRSADFLDTANYPKIRFQSRRVEKLRTGRLRVTGDLTIRGATREMVLEVAPTGRTWDRSGNPRAATFTAKTSLDRRDFGLTWNQALDAGGIMVSDRVEIEIEVEAVKQTGPSARTMSVTAPEQPA